MAPPVAPQEPIAIVGIAAQLPSGETSTDNLDHKQFFEFLLNKEEAYERIPFERFNVDSYKGRDAGQVSTEFGTFLKNTDQLDHVEFGITNKDAKAMSVSTRKLIELSFLALLDSGIDYRGQNVGCFASGIVFDVLSLSEPDEFEARGSFSGSPAMIANRVSYHLDLLGPSVPVDTACSSSLTATHLAVQSIRSGDCEAAVVGGIQLNHRFVDWVQYSQGGILAPDGKCKPFDVSANGFSRGEAGVAIVLKRLDQAVKDNDHIYATIIGTGINSAGSAAPVNAPVAAAQRDAMRRAWYQAGREPSEVDFVELHATGTAAGDPAEANWVGEAFQREDELLIGSVKGNIGHTEIAAFLASLTKVVNIFRTRTIPPNVNFSTPNPLIQWDRHRLHVPTERIQLPCHSTTGRSLISLCSSGIGGANGHVVLEAPPLLSGDSSRKQIQDVAKPLLLISGALSPRSATTVSETISELATLHPDRSRFISTIYGRRARQMPWRSFAVYTPGQASKVKFSSPVLVPRVKPPVVFVFAGQGPQHLDMGRELFQTYPVFKESILEMDEVYTQVTGVSLISSTGLFHKDASNTAQTPLRDIWPIEVTLPALAMLQCALFDLLASVGISPNIVVGHSAGETSVLYASGAGSKRMAVELAIARGKAMALVETAGGTMAAVSCGASDAHALIVESLGPELSNSVVVGCHNSQEAVTISGLTSSIDKVVLLAESRGIMARKLRTRVPVHSNMMDICQAEFKQLLEEMWSRYPGACKAQLPVYSTLSGDSLNQPFTSDYFWDGTRGPVLFTEAVTALLNKYPTATFMEVSPHPVLASYLSALGATSVISTLRRPKRNEHGPVEVPAFLDGLGRLTVLGHNQVNFPALNNDPILDFDFPLPSYPFMPKTVSYHSESASFYRQFQSRNGPLNRPGLRVNSQTHPILAQHVIKGEPIMPAAGFIEMALEFGAMVLWDVEFRAMMSLSGEQPIAVEVKLDGIHWTVKTATASVSARKHNSSFDKIHAEGYLSLKSPKTKHLPLNLSNILTRCQRIDLTHFYEDLKTFAEYGPAFQRVVDGYQGENEVLVLVRGDDEILDIDGYLFHPAILDCCLHFMVHKSFTLNSDGNVYYLPSKVGKLTLHQALVDLGMPDYVYAHIVFKAWTPVTLVADFYIVAVDGTHLCTLTQVEVERHESSPRMAVARRHDVVFQPFAIPATTPDERSISTSSHEDMRQLYRYLDYLASQAINVTLHTKPAVGTELDRKRYMEFSTAVAASYAPSGPFDKATVTAICEKWPEMIEVTDKVASVHGRIFETSKAAVEVLYKDDIMTRFYKHYDWASVACADRFRSLISGMIKNGKRVIRVLEVGAGTGALTRHLANVLDEFPSAIIEFVVSDVSKELLPRMAYPRCRYKSFDLSKPPATQGFDLASFDVITGFHVLHVVADMAPSLAVLSELLVPGGYLLIGDLKGDSWMSREPGSIWFDFVFGCFSEWFSFTDDRSHCTMSTQDWRKRLLKAGFGDVYTEEFPADPLLFTLEAQKLHRPDLRLSVSGNHRDQFIFHYRRGDEGLLRDKVSTLDASNTLSLWLFSSFGFDGYAGMGFFRSLGREYPLWDVHFVIFDGPWSAHEMSEFVCRLSCGPGLDPLLLIDEQGAISVPRVVPSAAPSGQYPFEPSLPWTFSGSELVQTSLVPYSADFVTVKVLAMSRPEGSLRTFVGRISSATTTTSIVADDLVVGLISSQDISNFITVHHASLARLPDAAEEVAVDIAGAALGLIIGCLACGVSTLRSSRRHRSGKALLSHGSDIVVPSLKWLLRLLDIEIIEAKSNSPADLAELAADVDLVLSGSVDRIEFQAFSPARVRKCRLFMWNDPGIGLEGILKDDPLTIGEALDFAIEHVAGHWPHSNVGLRLSDISILDAGTLVPSSGSLFDSNKAYLLVGGLGGLGIRVALWMYEKGARYLILTSRSGKVSLARVQDRLALRIITYLESLPDLIIRLEASDATSQDATMHLLRSIPIPLGGCMLLTVVLSDRTFAFQDDDDYRKVFASKTGVCSVVESCLPGGISALDFFISFSSVVGLFGNGGQTNYSSANTALDGMVRTWDNAFTFILPAVTDGGGLASETREQGGRLGHLTPWGMSSQRICDCLEDGIRKLADGPFWQYVPDLDWNLVQKHLGSSALFEHLIDATSEEGATHAVETGRTMADVVIELLDVDASEFSADVPFTAYGLDSLSAARLSFALRPHVAISQLQLLSDISLSDLQTRVEKVQEEEAAHEGHPTAPSPEPSHIETRVAEMENLIAKYTSTFPKHVSSEHSSPDGEVVLITGTTGAIGTSMLAQLASMPSITRIYAFNRADSDGSSTLRERQGIALRARGYDAGILDRGTIVLVEGDQSKQDLGIPHKLYEEIRSSVTSIIHNAWPVNFTASLASLEPSIRSVRVFVDIALKSSMPHPPRLLFLSSIGLFYNRTTAGPAPEEPITDGRQVIGTGYSESKWIGERILQRAAEVTPLRPTIVRAGQICGGLNGAWNTTEWFPTLVKSAIHLGSLPLADGDISWIPLHTAARSLIEMRNAGRQILHLSHPHPVPWSKVSEFLSKTLKIPLLAYENWLTLLEDSAGNPNTIKTVSGDSNPALRLLYYFRALEVGTNMAKEALGLPKLSVLEGMKTSPSLSAAEPLTTMDAARWINSWEQAGFLKV